MKLVLRLMLDSNFQDHQKLDRLRLNQIFKHYVINIEENFKDKCFKKNKAIYLFYKITKLKYFR